MRLGTKMGDTNLWNRNHLHFHVEIRSFVDHNACFAFLWDVVGWRVAIGSAVGTHIGRTSRTGHRTKMDSERDSADRGLSSFHPSH